MLFLIAFTLYGIKAFFKCVDFFVCLLRLYVSAKVCEKERVSNLNQPEVVLVLV